MDRTVVILGISTFLYCIYHIQAVDPCKDAVILPYLTQRLDGYTDTGNEICDFYLSEGWYSLGHYVLASANVTSCGTGVAWYMADPLPVQGRKVVKVCKHQGKDSKPCLRSSTVDVMICVDGNYVFKLHPLDVCNEAYCIRNKDKGEIGDKAPPDVSSLSKPKIRVETTKDGSEFQLMFYCDIDPIEKKNYYYVVEWSLGTKSTIGDLIKSSREEKYINKTHFASKTVMTEKDLRNFGIHQLGFSVICSVKAKNDVAGAFSQVIPSDRKFCGVQRKEVGPVKLSEHDHATEVNLRLTIPFGCSSKDASKCSISFTIFISKTDHCELSQATIAQSERKPCGIIFQLDEINKNKPFKVVHRFGQNMATEDNTNRIIQLISIPYPEHTIFGDYSIRPIIVELINKHRDVKDKRCHAHSDPHMLTFDGLTYEHQYQGKFILYKHRNKNTEVQIKTKPCPNFAFNQKVYCVCAVVIRAGRDIYAIDYCDKGSKPESKYRMCEDKLLKGQVKRLEGEKKYIIALPTGTVVEILNTWYEFFNVDIIPSPVDLNATEGLCGNFDKNIINDIQSNYQNPAWSVKSSDDLFDERNYAALSSFSDQIYLCQCSHQDFHIHNEALCDTSQQKLCTFDSRHDVDDKGMCDIQRRKRSPWINPFGGDSEDSDRSEITLLSTLPKDTILIRNLRRVNVYTNITARDECLKLMNTSVTQMCLNVPNLYIDSYINDCVTDALATSSMDWAKVHYESFKSKCIYQIRVNQPLSQEALEELEQVKESVKEVYSRLVNDSDENENITDILSMFANESVVENSSDFKFTPELLESVSSISCPFDCNSHGTCDKGKCACDSNFIGFDCSVKADEPPEMIGIPDNGLCDKKERLCGKTSVFAKSLVESEALSCRLEPFTISVNETYNTSTSVKTTATYETFSELSCKLPPKRTRRSLNVLNGQLAHGYYISVSNDGELFSEKDTLVIYNSICVDCTRMSQEIYCKMKPGYCVSDGYCYKKSESIDCMTCSDDLHGNLKWIHISGCVIKSNTGNEVTDSKLWILGAVLGPIICIIIISVYLCRMSRLAKIKRRQKAYSQRHEDVPSKLQL